VVLIDPRGGRTFRARWLEQEVIVLDHRMGEGLETARAAPNHPKR
jgi:hypothetical protein